MKIGDAAQQLGVAVHVLRHWDDEGVVVPDRSASGHREYTEDHLSRLRVLRACQGVGMSLPEIRQVLDRTETGRAEVIEQRIGWIQAQRRRLEHAERFLTHVVDCRHDLLTRCEGCSEYAATTTLTTTNHSPG